VIIDAHAHVADALTGFRRPLRFGKIEMGGQIQQWLPPSFDPPASQPAVLLGYMDQAGVDKAFLVQHYQYGDQNQTILNCVRWWPDRFTGFATLNAIDHPDDTDRLERLIDAGMAGLKVEVNSTRALRPGFRFDGEHEWGVWERLSQLRRPLVLDANEGTPEDTVAMQQMVERLPGLQMVICHMGGPNRPGWQERALLATHPRVWTDLAALPLMIGAGEEYPWVKAQEIVRWAVEQFGADKVMWGTDYPPILNAGTYRQSYEYISRHCDFLTAEEKGKVLGGTAQRFLREVVRG
jgi:L-galactono-1,5-lactonase